MVSDWETPVKIVQELRDTSKFPEVSDFKGLDVENGNQTTIVPSESIVLKQIAFFGANLFYERAKQRALVFIDISTEEGAKEYFRDKPIPKEMQDKDNPKRARKHLLWSRVDMFFYQSKDYQYPPGMDETILISVDKYPAPKLGTSEHFGLEKPYKQKEGHYNSAFYPDKPTLVPHEYSNVMKQYKFIKHYDPTKKEDLEQLSK